MDAFLADRGMARELRATRGKHLEAGIADTTGNAQSDRVAESEEPIMTPTVAAMFDAAIAAEWEKAPIVIERRRTLGEPLPA
jgi:hypothetical protein